MDTIEFYDWALGEFKEILKKERQKLPFHINLLEFFRTDENANSRILKGLLENHEILQSLFEFIGGNFAKLKVIEPQVFNEYPTKDKGRIDIFIKDVDYSIIIENKINGAKDRDKQIARYIDNTELSKSEGKIYVIYCTRYSDIPCDKSWGNKKEKYKNRFFNLTYRYHILPWLETIVLPEVKNKDVFLKSYIEQYIDYLQGLFNQRKFENDMNASMKNLIKNKIKTIDKNTIRECINVVEKLNDYLGELLQEIEQDEDREFIKNSNKEFRSDFKDKVGEISSYKENDGYPQFRVYINCNGTNLKICLEADTYNHSVYYGFLREKENENDSNVVNFLDRNLSRREFCFLKDYKETSWWYRQYISNKDVAYEEFIKLIENLSTLE